MTSLSGSGMIRPDLLAPKDAKALLGTVSVLCTGWVGSETVMATLRARRGENTCQLLLPENGGVDETHIHTPSGRDFFLKVRRHGRGGNRGRELTFTLFVDAAKTEVYGRSTITLSE